MIGYLLQQALRNASADLEVATLLTQVVVDADDPAFSRPTKPIGAVYDDADSAQRVGDGGWTIAADGPGSAAWLRRRIRTGSSNSRSSGT